MQMECVKARQNLIAVDLSANERFKDRGTLRARKLPLDAIVGVSLTQRLAAALRLSSADLWFRFRDDRHELATLPS